MFTETDKIKLKAIRIGFGQVALADKDKVKRIIANIDSNVGYKPIKVSHNLDDDTYTLEEGLETCLACWKLKLEWVDVEINY